MTPAPQEQSARIKELAEQYADAFADAKNSPWSGRLAALNKAIQEELRTAIDSLASECDRLQKDAARYLWLRDVSAHGDQFYLAVSLALRDTPVDLGVVDATIDADIAKQHSAAQGAEEGK